MNLNIIRPLSKHHNSNLLIDEIVESLKKNRDLIINENCTVSEKLTISERDTNSISFVSRNRKINGDGFFDLLFDYIRDPIYENILVWINVSIIGDEKVIDKLVENTNTLNFRSAHKERVIIDWKEIKKIEKSELYDEILELLQKKYPGVEDDELNTTFGGGNGGGRLFFKKVKVERVPIYSSDKFRFNLTINNFYNLPEKLYKLFQGVKNERSER